MTRRAMPLQPKVPDDHEPLYAQLGWFVRLRWIAGITVIIGSYAQQHWLQWYPSSPRGFVIGVFTLAYNAALYFLLRRSSRRENQHKVVLILASAQILLDMACLTCLTLWTGGIDSPLRGFFVFHMVFASLLLPRFMAYGSAAVAVSLFGSGLRLAHQWGAEQRDHKLSFAGWTLMLLLTVHLSNNITRRLRRQQRRLVKQNRHIKKMTRQLRRHQRALVQHEKMVTMGQMASGITHEIANPLASMDSLLQLLERKPEKMRPDAVATLREQISRINQIIQQMKNFSHPLELQRQTVSLNEVVEQSIDMVGFDRRIQRVTVERHLSPDVGEFPLVPQALQQVLVNLIVNALDALADIEKPRLVIRTERRDNWALIEVADNGHGIRPEHMGHLFEPFFTTKPIGKGTGLGLSISYSLIEKQGGGITVKSQPGKGTAFFIRLPLSADSREREGVSQTVSATENQRL